MTKVQVFGAKLLSDRGQRRARPMEFERPEEFQGVQSRFRLVQQNEKLFARLDRSKRYLIYALWLVLAQPLDLNPAQLAVLPNQYRRR